MIEKGKVRVNAQRITKPGRAVRAGDVLTLALGREVRVVRILGLGERRGPASEAQALYEDVPMIRARAGTRFRAWPAMSRRRPIWGQALE